MDGGRADGETPTGTRGVRRSARRSPGGPAGMTAASVGRVWNRSRIRWGRPCGAGLLCPTGGGSADSWTHSAGWPPLLSPRPEGWSFRACPQRHVCSQRPHRMPLRGET